MSIGTMDELFLHTLKDIYYAETKITKALPKMAKAAGSTQLRQAFEQHLEETKQQVERLKEVFKLVGQKAEGTECPAIEGIIEEGDELMKDVKDKEVLDAGLLSGAQAVEHYEIARYGTLLAWAKQLGHGDAAKLLQETLKEEKATDQILNKLALEMVNQKAA